MKQKRQEQGIAHPGMIIAILLFIAAIAFGGWWVWQKNKDENLKEIPNSSTQGNQNQEEVLKLPDGFQFYENNEFGFSFAYPKQLGPLTPGNTAGNSNTLLFIHSEDNKNAFAPHTQSPLYVQINKTDGFSTRSGKYGPILEYNNGTWFVSSKDGGSVLNGGHAIGSEYKPKIARTINGTPVYDLSFTDEGCYRTAWVFRLEPSFTTITLPVVCADEIGAIPQERLMRYEEVSDQVLETLIIN